MYNQWRLFFYMGYILKYLNYEFIHLLFHGRITCIYKIDILRRIWKTLLNVFEWLTKYKWISTLLKGTVNYCKSLVRRVWFYFPWAYVIVQHLVSLPITYNYTYRVYRTIQTWHHDPMTYAGEIKLNQVILNWSPCFLSKNTFMTAVTHLSLWLYRIYNILFDYSDKNFYVKTII